MIQTFITFSMVFACQEEPKLREGVYVLCGEVFGYANETLELKEGKFRYWFYSDVKLGDEPKYPLTGACQVKGQTLTLDSDAIHTKERTIDKINGVDVLWRKDALSLWEEKKRIHPYGVLLRVDGATDGSKNVLRPSIESIMTKEMKDRDKKEYEERFNDQPVEVRVLLRARTIEGDTNLDAYRSEIGKARIQPDPKLLSQLVGLIYEDSPISIKAENILEDLFLKTDLIEEAPPFLKNDASKQKALEDFIGALSNARDRKGVEHTILIFLRASEVNKIDLAIDEVGVRVSIRTIANGEVFGSDGPEDYTWVAVISKVIPACQTWMRAQISK